MNDIVYRSQKGDIVLATFDDSGNPKINVAATKQMIASINGGEVIIDPDPILPPDKNDWGYSDIDPDKDINGIVVSDADTLQEALNDGSGKNIYLKGLTYTGDFKIKHSTKILPYKNEKPFLTGAIEFNSGWVQSGKYWFHPWKFPLHQHPAHQTRTLEHRAAMQPHMLIFEGVPMKTVYNQSDLVAGSFFLEGTASSPKGFWAIFPNEVNPNGADVMAAKHQRILSGNTTDVDGVSLYGLQLAYAANTALQGMIELYNGCDDWVMEGMDIQWSNGEGLRLSGRRHNILKTVVNNHGINGLSSQGMNDSTLKEITASFNSWKNGLDPKWDAGNKFRNSKDNKFYGFVAEDNEGAGFWFDIHNYDNEVVDFVLRNNKAFGFHMEHFSQRNTLRNGLIENTRKFEGIGSGLQIQGNILGCKFIDIVLRNNEDGAVYYKKSENRNGGDNFSGNNVFDNIVHENNGNNNRWVIQGDPNFLKDTYSNMTLPDFTVWS